LRTGRTREGISLNRPDAVMSTAEAVNVLHAAALEAAFLDNGTITGGHVARQIQGVILKDAPEDGKRFKAYVDHIIKERAGKSGPWRDFYQSARTLKLG
jgi:hypothetical protein